MAEPLWVILGEPDASNVRGISIDGTIVIAVRWTPTFQGLAGEEPAGYYFEAGNIVHAELLEAAEEPTSEGWQRVRERAFRALADGPDRLSG